MKFKAEDRTYEFGAVLFKHIPFDHPKELNVLMTDGFMKEAHEGRYTRDEIEHFIRCICEESGYSVTFDHAKPKVSSMKVYAYDLVVVSSDSTTQFMRDKGNKERFISEAGISSVIDDYLEKEKEGGCDHCGPCGSEKTYRNQAILPLNGKTVCVDWCIHHIVSALNAGGIRTKASCCGHKQKDGTILLEDGRELIIKNPEKS